MDNFKFAQLQTFRLAGAGATIGDTTLVLTSFQTIDGSNLTMSDFGTYGYGTIQPDESVYEEQIRFSGITQNANGTATLTGVSSIGFVYPYTVTANITKSHPGGAAFVISNTAAFYDRLASKDNDEVILGQWQFPDTEAYRPRGVSDTDTAVLAAYVTFGQLARTTFAGTVNASTIQKGIVEIATDAENGAGTGTGGTGAILVAASSSHNYTSAASKIPVGRASDGKIDSSWGGGASSLATLNAGSLVVENPANATAVPTASKIPIADTDGKLYGWFDGLQMFNYTAGENIDASTTPQALYVKESDGRVYKLNASTASETLFAFIGFAPLGQNVTTGNAIHVQLSGVVKGFTALTLMGYYYGTNTPGAISTTAGTKTFKVGRAKSTTELLIEPGKKITNGVISFASSTSSTITIGYKPSRVRVEGFQDTDHTSSGGWTINGSNSLGYSNGSAGGATATISYAWHLGNAGNDNVGTISAVSSTGFTLTNVTTGAPGTAQLYWEAEE